MTTCADAIKNATGKDYELSEIDEFIKQADLIRNRIMNDNNIADKSAAIEKALDDVKAEMVAAAKIEKRNAMINKMRQEEAIDFITSQFGDDVNLGVEALLVGSEKNRKGARYSVDAQQKALAASYTGGLAHDLEQAGLFKMAVSGEKDRMIAKALAGEPVNDQEAISIANIIQKYQEASRRDANRAGAWIKKIDGYITRQTHDPDLIAKESADDYIEFLKQKLDLDKTLEGVENETQFFDALYNALASGVHLSSSPKDITKAFKGAGNLAKRMSEGRLLHFKNADSFMDYNQRFGTGSLMSTITSGLEMSGHKTGIMRVLGTNPDAMYDVIYDRLTRKATTAEERQALTKSKEKNAKYLKEVDGSTKIAGNQMIAKYASNLRAWQSMSKLGGALLSSFADLPVYASEVRYQGGNMLSGLGESLMGLKKGRGDVEHRQIMANLGVTMDSFIGDISGRFDVQGDYSGLAQKAMNQFFKWNGLTWWTDSLKRSAAIGSSNRLFQEASKAFADVNPALRRVMELYGIGENEWNVIRKAKQTASDGTGFLTPEALRKLPDDEFSSLLENAGLKATDYRIEMLKDELEGKLRSYVSDRQGYAVLETDARTNATWNRGTQRGTLPGELLRSMAQFKQYPTVFLQRILGREIRGKSKSTGLGMAHDSVLYGVASLITALTVAGYVSMSAKDIVKGRKPRDPLDLGTMRAAFLQGGGMGIYGDFIFGDVKNRFGGSLLDTIAGPTIGLIPQAGDLWGRIRSGDDFAATMFTTALNNTPFLNLFYTRIALDYLILYDIRESLNPGYLRRMERRIKKENDQEFLLPPSTTRARPITD
ncbi:hypothetical protein PB787_002196 [Vibrio parahaemolyticus]|nr:hypothetical protein [Vibrio parahaemolyticus]